MWHVHYRGWAHVHFHGNELFVPEDSCFWSTCKKLQNCTTFNCEIIQKFKTIAFLFSFFYYALRFLLKIPWEKFIWLITWTARHAFKYYIIQLHPSPKSVFQHENKIMKICCMKYNIIFRIVTSAHFSYYHSNKCTFFVLSQKKSAHFSYYHRKKCTFFVLSQ